MNDNVDREFGQNQNNSCVDAKYDTSVDVTIQSNYTSIIISSSSNEKMMPSSINQSHPHDDQDQIEDGTTMEEHHQRQHLNEDPNHFLKDRLHEDKQQKLQQQELQSQLHVKQSLPSVGDRPLQRPRRRKISFGHVDIFEFPYGISSSSVCNAGPPIALADRSAATKSITEDQNTTTTTTTDAARIKTTTTVIWIDDYESYRLRERRPRSDLHLSADRRKELLLENGYNIDEISEATKDANLIRRQRAETIREIRLKFASTTTTTAAAPRKTSMKQTISFSPSYCKDGDDDDEDDDGNESEDVDDESNRSMPFATSFTDVERRNQAFFSPTCPSPVATSPLKRRRERWNTRPTGIRGVARDSLSPPPRRRCTSLLVDSLSPPSESFRRLSCWSPQKNSRDLHKNMAGILKSPPRLSLSPPRPLRDRTQQLSTSSVPMPSITPKRKRGSSDQLNCTHMSRVEENFGYMTERENEIPFLSPSKRHRTPNRKDRPLVLPSRSCSPPPSPLVSSRVFYPR